MLRRQIITRRVISTCLQAHHELAHAHARAHEADAAAAAATPTGASAAAADNAATPTTAPRAGGDALDSAAELALLPLLSALSEV